MGSSIALPSRLPSRTPTSGDLDLQPPPERIARSSCSTYGGCRSMFVLLSCRRNTLPDAPASLSGQWGLIVQANSGAVAVSMNPLRTEKQPASLPPCPAPPPCLDELRVQLASDAPWYLSSALSPLSSPCESPPALDFLHCWHRGPTGVLQQWTS